MPPMFQNKKNNTWSEDNQFMNSKTQYHLEYNLLLSRPHVLALDTCSWCYTITRGCYHVSCERFRVRKLYEIDPLPWNWVFLQTKFGLNTNICNHKNINNRPKNHMPCNNIKECRTQYFWGRTLTFKGAALTRFGNWRIFHGFETT